MFIHEKALVESNDIGEGTRVWAFTHVLKGSIIGKDCNICGHCYIEGGAVIGNNVKIKNGVSVWDRVTIEDNVFVGPNAVFTNDINPRAAIKKKQEGFLPVMVKHGATIGANATIVCGITIGRYAFIGAGTVVVKDVPDYALVVGNPSKNIGYMCECGNKLKEEEQDSFICKCGKTYGRQGDSITVRN